MVGVEHLERHDRAEHVFGHGLAVQRDRLDERRCEVQRRSVDRNAADQDVVAIGPAPVDEGMQPGVGLLVDHRRSRGVDVPAVAVLQRPQLIDQRVLRLAGDLSCTEESHAGERAGVGDREVGGGSACGFGDVGVVEHDEGRLGCELESILVEVTRRHDGVVARHRHRSHQRQPIDCGAGHERVADRLADALDHVHDARRQLCHLGGEPEHGRRER